MLLKECIILWKKQLNLLLNSMKDDNVIASTSQNHPTKFSSSLSNSSSSALALSTNISLIHKPNHSQPSLEVHVDACATKIVGHENITNSENITTLNVVNNVHKTQQNKTKKNIEVVKPVPTRITWGTSNEYHIGISMCSECEFGFPWASNSCGFDSVLSGLWFIFRHASENFRSQFRLQLHPIASIFDMMLNNEINNLEAKDKLIELYWNSTALSGNFESADKTFELLYKMLDVAHPTPLFQIGFVEIRQCDVCTYKKMTRSFVNELAVWKRNYRPSIQDIVDCTFRDYYLDAKVKECHKCSSNLEMKREILTKPWILNIDYLPLTELTAPDILQEILEFHDSQYKLIAVLYFSPTHFMTRYQSRTGQIYDYDGMSKCFMPNKSRTNLEPTKKALCQRRQGNANSLFTGVIKNLQGDTYIVAKCFYVLNV